jgi:diguanylate cyclase (GGDEF)-like protein
MNRSVLLIDDSTDIHFKVRYILQEQPIDLVAALSAQEGLALATKSPPDLILLDVDMPEIDGFDVCQSLKSNSLTSTIPVIFLTGASSTEAKIHGLGLGAVDYITKPFDAPEFKARVEAALRTKSMIDSMGRRAMVDGLTGLWNRSYFDECISAEISQARRHEHALCLILLDVDHFKLINDTHGHPAGDEVLRNFGRIVGDAMRAGDKVARIGGEEFAILCPSTDIHGATVLAERIRQIIETTEFDHKGIQLRVTASFGVTDGGDDPHITASNFFDRADQALYTAKRGGRNQVAALPGAHHTRCIIDHDCRSVHLPSNES